MRSTYTWIYNIAVGVVGLYLLGVFQRRTLEGFQAVRSSPLFTDAYVITMDKYPERFPRIKANAEEAGIKLKKWPGVEVKKEDVASLPAKGVGTLLYSARAGGQKRNLGAIGCFLAHRALLEHIAKNPVGLGTLICEDDIEFLPDFYEKLDAVASEIPDDWDYIFMDKFKVNGTSISTHIVKLEQDLSSNTNMGTWAFIVKNASIGKKILPLLAQMTDEIDLQLSRNAHILNTYVIRPTLINLHSTANESTILKIDEGAF